ncbi:MAG: aminodeoxychorismate/anthranilate synthase component II [Gemmatimonadetes bacterium]|nr:aminodeoxychorismate/anthranilate synthase component II [Gemmatimonadota bacterium]MCA9768400.1 aminodeoxychorismate/anthranilate synthase component II [Gemmatimonadota bacterium]MCB9505322.1 aminodeoxychorismate/anthranilate synthase component II [Gemmatimonadales bacterium]MCB9518030.1 aminodeoxychorismate/anthranilate synthase component II [Gemmatimonadales bacterium]HPF60998.1 aminodeoxychorismate/anthranilate synthase component II [Gemmatimonadales bacterium]
MILLLDHQDSFVHTLAGYVRRAGWDAVVQRDDATSAAEIARSRPDGIILSPGPCTPADCPVALEVVERLGESVPILGVCLGHQVIAAAHGALVAEAAHPRHGMTSRITHDGMGIYRGLASPLEATRYHSLAVREGSLPASLRVTARADDGEVMGIRHATRPIEGVQFHPESILTTEGASMIGNWLGLVAGHRRT